MKSFFKGRLSSQNYERVAIIGRCLRDLRTTFRAHATPLQSPRLGAASQTTGSCPLSLTDIREALDRLEICRGDLLLVHSSANTLFESGIRSDRDTPSDPITYSEAIVDLLIEHIGPHGTLLMPTEPPGDVFLISRNQVVFDYRRTPSNRGLITELFRRRSDVVRSVHPRYNITGRGPLADELMRDHHRSVPYTMDENSPWYKFTQRNGKVLMLGPGLDNNSLVHLPEYLYPHDYPRALYYNKPFPFCYVTREGITETMDVAIHALNWVGGECFRFCQYLQEKYGLYKVASAGCAEFVCYDSKAQFEAICAEMRANVCWNDVRYWAKSA
jgi:aminoglycoside N3'-acetyltransferase